jgi:hypothetical protein
MRLTVVILMAVLPWHLLPSKTKYWYKMYQQGAAMVKWFGILIIGQQVPSSNPAVGVILWVSLFVSIASPQVLKGNLWLRWYRVVYPVAPADLELQLAVCSTGT